MALSSYYRQYDNQNLAELERQKEALRQMSETQKQLVNENADASIKQIQETGNANIRQAEHAYDGVINTANVQKLINERQVAERMANLGLTDSGLNRTQQTAVQVSHANQVNNAQVARQRQIDALALAINQQIGQVNIQRTNDLTNLDLAHQQNLYSVDEQYRANRDSWAASQYQADQSRAAAEYKARLENERKLAEMGLEAEEKAAKEKQAARDKIINQLSDDNLTTNQKTSLMEDFRLRYGRDEALIAIASSFGLGGVMNDENKKTWYNGNTSDTTPEAEPYVRAEGEDLYTYSQRVADESFINSRRGKYITSKLGLGTLELPKYNKTKAYDLIWDAYESNNITEPEAISLIRNYAI